MEKKHVPVAVHKTIVDVFFTQSNSSPKVEILPTRTIPFTPDLLN